MPATACHESVRCDWSRHERGTGGGLLCIPRVMDRRVASGAAGRPLAGYWLLLGVLTAGCAASSQPVVVAAPSSGPSSPGHVRELGSVGGRLLFVGGLPPGKPRPVPVGTVTLHGPVTVRTHVDGHGRFSMTAPKGVYRATGSSSQYGSGSYTCRAQGSVEVTASHQSRTDVYCQLR